MAHTIQPFSATCATLYRIMDSVRRSFMSYRGDRHRSVKRLRRGRLTR
jgi:hypothetical protein